MRSVVSLALVLVASTVSAGEKTPAIVVRVRSVEAVLDSSKLLVSLTGEEAAARQIEGLLKAKVGVKGIEGIDPARPVGAYVRFGAQIEDVSGALLVPIADRKAFLDLLDRFNFLTSKGKNDIYTVQTGRPFDLYFRFVDGYAYVTGINPDNLLDKNLLDAAAVLGGTDDRSIVTTMVRLDLLPEGAKLLAQFQVEQELQKLQARTARTETPAQKALRLTVFQELGKAVATILKEGGPLRLDIGIDQAAREFALQFSLAGQPGSELDKTLQKLGKSQSPFAGLAGQDLAFLGGVDLSVPDTVNDALAKVIDETMSRSLAEIRDAQKKKQAADLFEALAPSLRAGKLDGFFALSGPAGKTYTALTALELRDGDKLGSTMRALIAQTLKDLPPREQDKIRLDADKAGAIAIHRFELPPGKGPSDAKFQEMIGDRDLYIAFRDDAVFFALGKAALPTLKEALTRRGSAATPAALLNFDVARLVPILAKTREQNELAKKILTPGQDSTLRIAVTGGAALTLRLQLKLSALEFLAKMKDSKRSE